jgi:hypothetical protein
MDIFNDNILNESYILLKDDNYWQSPFVSGPSPGARYHHAACQIKDM